MFDSKDKELKIDKIDESECAGLECASSDVEMTEQHNDVYNGSHQDFFVDEKNVVDSVPASEKSVEEIESMDEMEQTSKKEQSDIDESQVNLSEEDNKEEPSSSVKSNEIEKENSNVSSDDLTVEQEQQVKQEEVSVPDVETQDSKQQGEDKQEEQIAQDNADLKNDVEDKSKGDMKEVISKEEESAQDDKNDGKGEQNGESVADSTSGVEEGSNNPSKSENNLQEPSEDKQNTEIGSGDVSVPKVEGDSQKLGTNSNKDQKVEEEKSEQSSTTPSDDCVKDETVSEVIEEPSVLEENQEILEVEENLESPQKRSKISDDLEKISEDVEEIANLEESTDTQMLENEEKISVESEEEVVDVDSFNDYGEAIQVFATVAPKFIPDDPRVPAEIKKASGTISQFGPTVGGVDLEFTSTASGIDERYKFQGKAKAAFVLTGEVLDANVTITALGEFTETSMKYRSNAGNSTIITNTLRNFLIKAANETIDDINGFKTDGNMEYGVSAPVGIPNITHRAHLIKALRKVFKSNNGSSVAKVDALKFTFKDLDETTPKQVTLVYNGQAMFPTSVDYTRNIIIEDSLVNNLPRNSKTRTLGDNTKTSNVNFDPTKIAINFDIKSRDVNKGLKTNTNYEFIALNKNFTFFKDATQSAGTSIKFLEGFTLSNFKTGKKPPLFETLLVSTSNSLEPSALIALSPTTSTSSLISSIDFNAISKTTFLDYANLVSATAQSHALKISGASIKFNTVKIYDTDSTITKIEVEDDRANKYPVSLIPINDSDKSQGANPQVNGLQMSTPYHFKKLHVTAQPEETLVTKTLTFGAFTTTTTGTVTVSPNHNLLIRTSNFSEPSLFIESTPIFVSVANGTTSTIASSSFTLPAFLPKFDVLLPNKVKMPAVSNDKTSLRYVIEVDNSDGRAGELTVNGLKGDENYKVQKFVGKDKNFYVVNLYNLSEKRDYGFLIFELSYKDLDGRELIARKVLSEINRVVSVTTTSGTTTTIQFPNYDLDNTTGPERTGIAAFNVTLFEQTLVEARRAEIPVFIDDMNSSFLRLEFRKPENNPNVEVKLENGILKFSNLEPKTDVVYKLDFVWKDKDGQEKTLSKYAKIVTPDVQVVDVKSTSITTDQSSATIVFKLYSQPKLPIVSVSLNDDKYKYSWDKDKLELVITGLTPKTEYRDIEVTFKLENGLTAKHKLDVFTTKEEVAPPKGKVADFVAKIYRIALNREPEINGWRFWVSKLESKEISVGQFINDLMVQDEFIDRFLSKEDFIKMMYQIVLGREPEEEGKNYWMGKYDEYKTQEDSLINLRMRIASEMMNEKEFKEYVSSMGLRY